MVLSFVAVMCALTHAPPELSILLLGTVLLFVVGATTWTALFAIALLGAALIVKVIARAAAMVDDTSGDMPTTTAKRQDSTP